MKECSNKECDHLCEDFYKNKSQKDGFDNWCKKCKNKAVVENMKNNPEKRKQYLKTSRQRNREKYRARITASNVLYKLRKSKRTPKWLTKDHLDHIKCYYQLAQALTNESGVKHDVDHIVPLNGKNVSGLHVPWNLQVMDHIVNIKKGNDSELKSIPY